MARCYSQEMLAYSLSPMLLLCVLYSEWRRAKERGEVGDVGLLTSIGFLFLFPTCSDASFFLSFQPIESPQTAMASTKKIGNDTVPVPGCTLKLCRLQHHQN